jgi:hypothetical protein
MPLDQRSPSPELADILKETIGMVANILLLLAVSVIWSAEDPLFGRHQISFQALAVFDGMTLMLIAYYGLLIAADKLTLLLTMLANAVRTDLVEDKDNSFDRSQGMGVIRRLTSNLWLPTTFNFFAVTWLIYASGGIASSPYFPVPLAMMAIGQSIYRAPAVTLGTGNATRRLLNFVVKMIHLYNYPLILVSSLLVLLERLQEVHPLVATPAPVPETIITTLLCMFVTMCVTFITRRADQAKARGF